MTPVEIKQAWEETTGQCWPDEGCFTAGEYDHHILAFANKILNAALEKAADVLYGMGIEKTLLRGLRKDIQELKSGV